MAFSTDVPLPAWDDIPEDFRQSWSRRNNLFCHVACTLLYKGGKLADFKLKPKPGVDEEAAQKVIRACLGSLESKHQHKIAGVGYMLSEWFEPTPAGG